MCYYVGSAKKDCVVAMTLILANLADGFWQVKIAASL